jgi:hypothetical protein
MNRPFCVASLLALLICTTVAHAQDQSVTFATREIAKQAFQAYDEGRYEEAAEKSLKAYQVVRVPTIAVMGARALVKLGKLVAASELYLEATRIERDPTWQAVQDDAIRDAERERTELLARIPRLRFSIEGADARHVAVIIDGVVIPAALRDVEQVVNPGQHLVVGRIGEREVREVVTPKEGDLLHVTLKFTPQPTPEQHRLPAPEPRTETTPEPVSTADKSPPHSDFGEPSKALELRKTIGWVAVGLGGVGFATGVIGGLVARSKRETLLDSDKCSEDGTHCDSSLSSDVNSYNSMRTVSTTGFVSAALLGAIGAGLLLMPTFGESQPKVALRLGPTYLGFVGELP